MRKGRGELLELVCRDCDSTDTQGLNRCVTQYFWTLPCGSVKEGFRAYGDCRNVLAPNKSEVGAG